MKPNNRFDLTKAHSHAAMRGFTLMEMMIAIVIMGVLVAIALPQYNNSVLKAHRTDAKAALTDLAQREEKFYSVNNTYTATLGNLYPGATGSSMAVQSGTTSYYTLTVAVSTATSNTAAYYIGTASPTGSQANDTCGSLTLDSNGVTSNSGTVTSGCW